MDGAGSKTLIINSGSSSLKFRLYQGNKILLDEEIEEIGSKGRVKTFSKAAEEILERIDKDEIKKIVYRVVHGGEMESPKIVNSKVIAELKRLIPLAPLHMQASLEIIKYFSKIRAKHIICFDTSFHHEMPEVSKKYAIPSDIAKRYGIKRYGFHGIAHSSLLEDVEKRTGKKFHRAITCQLGNGASVCAIKNGKSIDTTMGFTPLEGLMMGTRSGNIDPAIINYLSKKGLSVDKITTILEKESGLKGIAGISDVKELLVRERKGDEKARLALDMFAHQAKKAIGSYIGLLGGVDLIVLGGGICRAPKMRERILSGMEELGIHLNKNTTGNNSPSKISSGKVEIWVIETDEQNKLFETSKNI